MVLIGQPPNTSSTGNPSPGEVCLAREKMETLYENRSLAVVGYLFELKSQRCRGG